MKNYLLGVFLMMSLSVVGQTYYPTNLGTKTKESHFQAFTELTLHPQPGETIENGTLLIRDGKVVAAGSQVKIPENSIVRSLPGQHVYPSFIDLYTSFGIDEIDPKTTRGRSTQYKANQEGGYWNDHILSDYQAISDYSYNEKEAKIYREAGFGIVNTHREDGIHRGTGVLVALTDEKSENDRILQSQSAAYYSFSKSKQSNQSYPSSVMGAMALHRQVYHDANWYRTGNSPTKDLDLEAVLKQRSLPKIFEANNKLNVLRAAKVSTDLKENWIIKASGQEFEHLNSLKSYGNSLILPLNFPKPYDVSDPSLLEKITLGQMRDWNQAPTNPAKMAAAKIPFAITMDGVDSPNTFIENLRRSVAYGLSEKQALASLTTVPAKLIGQSEFLGVIKPKAWANFIITSGPFFELDSKILDHYVKGNRHRINDAKQLDLDGTYTLQLDTHALELELENSTQEEEIELTVLEGEVEWENTIKYENGQLNITLSNAEGLSVILEANVKQPGMLKGTGIGFVGDPIQWNATLKKEENKERFLVFKPATTSYPNNGFGFKKRPKQVRMLFKNATVWTNEIEGILSNADVLIGNGKIIAVGTDLIDTKATVIDATGKHITSGIIDEHSHIAASSINEGGQNSSAEVTIEDVVDPDDIDIYRNLAGGVTTIQILHGSANPIGGRSAIIKLKWGETAENMLFPNADPFIKFALGENVKQSNWGSYNRFPQTRMGVEQVFVDYFQRAKEYGTEWTQYNQLSARQKRYTTKPRYDIEMEILWEILRGDRFISCHSYVQSEINMLMKVAERFGIRINTFTHILEGYKVADKMATHGAAGSTFSDWWAYKYEVKDAIPYNGAIMHRAGVNVAFNSDDSEMSRRLNQEAAKAVKYGGISEEDAWKFVTLNPAKILHLDDRVGSLKAGKHADLVLWTDHPMSVYTKAEKTLVDGIVYYDAERAKTQLEKIADEKKELIAQMVQAANNGMTTQAPINPQKREFHCETLD